MNEKRQIFGWAMYDWANSAYATTVLVAVFPLYFGTVIVPPDGFTILGRAFSATALLGFMSSAAALILFISAPVLGAISDFSASKKKFLMVFCMFGSLSSSILFFCRSGDVWTAMLLFIITQIGFVGGNIFYDAFLPHIASEDRLDRVSGMGYAYGYIGGGIQFALSLALIAGHEAVGITEELAARLSMAMAGLWWAGFSIVTFVILEEHGTAWSLPHKYLSMPKLFVYVRVGIERTVATAKKVRRFKHLLLFLIAFMMYNDAIQTVIKMSAIYGKQELRLSSSDIMWTLLMIQFIAFFGALLFGFIAEKTSAKYALMVTLVLWTLVVIYGYSMNSAKEFFLLGAIVGMVMGGSQALSRSLYGAMIPRGASAEFYGFYSVFTKFSAIWGTAIFALVENITGSSRNSIVSLGLFFIFGLVLLSQVNVAKAKEAREAELFET